MNQVQTTLTIEIIYYFIINAIKISILLCYLRIGKYREVLVRISTNDFPSCGQTIPASMQSHHLFPRYFLRNLCSLLSGTVHPTPQDVGLHRYGRRHMYQHDGAVLQGVPINITRRPLLTHFSNKRRQHRTRYLDPCTPDNNASQSSTTQSREARPDRNLQSRSIQLHCIHRAPPLDPDLHRIHRPLLRQRAHQPLEHGRSQLRHPMRLDPVPQSALLQCPTRAHPKRHIPVPRYRT